MLEYLILENTTSSEALDKLMERLGISDYVVKKDERGKPYFVRPERLFLSFSHSENLTLVAVADSEIGADIEKNGLRERVLGRFYTAVEQKKVKAAKNPAAEFTKIWTIKEAYAKMLGTGLSHGLQKIDTNLLQEPESEVQVLSLPHESSQAGPRTAFQIAICRRRH